MNATLDDDNNTSTSYRPFATTTSGNDNDDIDQSMATSQYEETVALQQLKQKLESISADAKSSLVHAQKVTDIINDDHLLGFLYAENFNIDVSLQISSMSHLYTLKSFLSDTLLLFVLPQLALKRLIRYWKRRHQVFGDKYTLPLTLYGMDSNMCSM